MNWWVGCSGFYYKEWKDIFYPPFIPSRDWFLYYASQFRAVELNVTFYRFPKESSFKNWYEQSPADFKFAVKVPRLITHYKRFSDVGKLLEDFYTTVRDNLKEKLGPVLFQLPPQLHFSTDVLENIIQQVDPSIDNILEFRHVSWWRQEVKEKLTDHNISFCGISYPGLPDEVIINAPTAYYRFHGVPQLYHSSYTEEQLQQVVKYVETFPGLKNGYIFFNNTASAAAIDNAWHLQQFTEEMIRS